MSQAIDRPDPHDLVARLANEGERRDLVYAQLAEYGPEALDAVREGLRHGNPEVRRWCALWFDHNATPEALPELIPLLRDPKSKVRLFALHSLACDRCKTGDNPVDAVPLLIERIQQDPSIRVRRHATMMLGLMYAHPDLLGFFQQLLDTETDPKLHKHAGIGWFLCRKLSDDPIEPVR
jgi:hypothetical protein